MSLNRKKELTELAKITCRRLRKVQTPQEKKLWELLRKQRLAGMRFLRQYPIFFDLNGRESFFVADFYYHKAKLIIELDGPIHNYKLREDDERVKILNQLGFSVLRINNTEFENDPDVVLKILIKFKTE